jgi:signal transduction histidine kinase/ActR/RegA family two-component response regulator
VPALSEESPAPRKRQPATWPLRGYFLLLALGTLFPVVAFSVALVFQVSRQARVSAEERLLQGARGTSAGLDRMFESSMRALEALAQSEHLDDGRLDEFSREASRMEAAQPTWVAITLSAPSGTTLLDTRSRDRAALPPPAETDSLMQVAAQRVPAVGDLAVADGVATFAVRVPVLRDGQLRYILSATLLASAVSEILRSDSHPPSEWTRGVVDGHGVVVARTLDPERFVGQGSSPAFRGALRAGGEGVFPSSTFEQVKSYVAFHHSSMSDWAVAVVVDRDRLDAPVRTMALSIAGLGLFAVGFAILGTYVLSRRLSRGIAAAARAADALAAGGRPELPPSGLDELDRLGSALQRSGALLAERERERAEHLALEETSRVEAERASRAKDEFLAMLGHELRNPLSPIVNAVQLLRLRGVGELRELAVIDRQVQHLVRLVDDLLDVARITRGRVALQLEPIRVSTAVARAVETTMPLLEARQHRLSVDVPSDLVVRGDLVRLAQAVGNLLANAARYTPARGHVDVRARRQGTSVVLEVEDDGEGMAPELVARVFELFVQGPRSIDRKDGGLGVGLSLVRSLVERHGGTVAAFSAGPGLGSTFTVTLPALAQSTAVAPERRPSQRGPTRRVLVVDDNTDSAELLSELLREAGHEVATAHDGVGALKVLGQFTPDVAILDVGLPEMDGCELARRISRDLGARAPALVSLTGYGQPADRDRCRTAGFRCHVVKPADPQVLLDLVEELAQERDQVRPAPGPPPAADAVPRH